LRAHLSRPATRGRPCQPLAIHLRRLAQGHRPQWQGHWRCLLCPLRGAHLAKRPCLRMHPTSGRRATFKRPPWTMFPKRPQAGVASTPRTFSAEPSPNRRCVIVEPTGLPPPRGAIAHAITTTGDYDWCGRCGRTTAAAAAGRQQQWRRPCIVLPSHRRKLLKGHLLTFDGHWHCLQCPCPPQRLTVKRCRGPSSTAGIPPQVEAQPAPGSPPDTCMGSVETAVKRQLSLHDFFRAAPPGHRIRLGSPSRQGVG